jgi:DNA-nicking Smr family endonuclease
MSDKYEVQEYPVDGILDLHAFKPNEINSLIPEYITECIKRNIVEIRIIHGKGKGCIKKGSPCYFRTRPTCDFIRNGQRPVFMGSYHRTPEHSLVSP